MGVIYALIIAVGVLVPTNVLLLASNEWHISTASTIGLGIASSTIGICVSVLAYKIVGSILLFRMKKKSLFDKYPRLNGLVVYSLILLLIIWMTITQLLAHIATIFIMEEGILR